MTIAAQPWVIKDSANNLILYVGSTRGAIFKYIINPAKLDSGFFQLIDSNDVGSNLGGNATVSVADINNDGKMEYLIGTSGGGLLMYSDSNWDPGAQPLAVKDVTPDNPNMRIYPNPARDYFVCSSANGAFINPRVDVYDLLGEKVNVGVQLSDGNVVVNTEQLSSGFYLVRITDAGKTYPGKVLVGR